VPTTRHVLHGKLAAVTWHNLGGGGDACAVVGHDMWSLVFSYACPGPVDCGVSLKACQASCWWPQCFILLPYMFNH
jgi:hypothetical protein